MLGASGITFSSTWPLAPLSLTSISTHPDVLELLVSLCKRRGFIFQSSEIYGGTGSVWDYGPLGVELKKNLKDRWWHSMVRARDDIEGIDAAILMHREVWVASGHVAGFTDPLVDCRNCKKRFRADDAKIKGVPGTPDAQCPACGMKGTLSAPRLFNLMFRTFMGPVEDSAACPKHYSSFPQYIWIRKQCKGEMVKVKSLICLAAMLPLPAWAQGGDPAICKLRGELMGAVARERDKGVSREQVMRQLKRQIPSLPAVTRTYVDAVYDQGAKVKPDDITVLFEYSCLKSG